MVKILPTIRLAKPNRNNSINAAKSQKGVPHLIGKIKINILKKTGIIKDKISPYVPAVKKEFFFFVLISIIPKTKNGKI